MDVIFLMAGIGSVAIAALHVFAGGPQIAAPMVRSEALHPVVRYTNYYCWHLVTISLVLLAAAFLWPAFDPAAWEVAVFGTVMAGGFSIWGLVLVLAKGQSFVQMPQGWLFLPIAVLGAWGLVA